MSKLVVFDIDRTIYNGSVFLDFSLHLVQKNIISPKFLSSIGFEFVTYQTGFESYDELVRDCLNYFFQEIKILKLEDLQKELKECLLKNHHKFYDFALSTLRNYPEYNYVIISLEPDLIVSEVAKFLKIKNFASNKFLENNKFVSNLNLTYDKKYLLNQTIYANQKPFAAFGDSESDLGILLEASHKFIINPTSKLLKEIEKENLNNRVFSEETVFEEIQKTF